MSDSTHLQRPSPRRLRLLGILALAIALALALTGITARTLREHALKRKIDIDIFKVVLTCAVDLDR